MNLRASIRPDDRKTSLRQAAQSLDWTAILVLVLLTAALSGLIFYRRIALPTDNDYSNHIMYSQMLLSGKISKIPASILAHPGLHILLAGLFAFTHHLTNWDGLLIFVLAATQVLIALVLYFFWFEPTPGKRWRRVFWSLTLSLVAPVMLFAFEDHQYYFGYIGLANYHNPTVVILRPLALLSFLFAIRIFTQAHNSNRSILISAVIILLSALVKPNYAITILIGLAGLVVVYWLFKKPMDWRMLIFGFGVPAVGILALQWVFLYLRSGNPSEGILLLPFQVESAFSKNLLPKFLLSILFPLGVALIFNRDALQKVELQLAWLTFLAGAFQMYFLAEGGDRMLHGNFRWSAQIALFLLFAASARYLYLLPPKTALNQGKARWFANCLYLAHLFAGAAYYLVTFFTKSYS